MTGGGAREPAARGHGASPTVVREKEEGVGSFTHYLDSEEKRRGGPATVSKEAELRRRGVPRWRGTDDLELREAVEGRPWMDGAVVWRCEGERSDTATGGELEARWCGLDVAVGSIRPSRGKTASRVHGDVGNTVERVPRRGRR